MCVSVCACVHVCSCLCVSVGLDGWGAELWESSLESSVQILVEEESAEKEENQEMEASEWCIVGWKKSWN